MTGSKSEFISFFNKIARYHNPYTVFSDFVKLSAISLHNGICHNDELEQEYLSLINTYEKEHVDLFPKMLGCCVNALEVRQDFLGDLFMSLELGSKHTGQFFTSYDLSRMMASMLFSEQMSLLDERPFIKLSEPACGAGGMVIAQADAMLEAGYNPQQQLYAQCIDVDATVAMMCYVQLSLLGIPAQIVIGNSLSLSCSRVMYTPMYYIGRWKYKVN